LLQRLHRLHQLGALSVSTKGCLRFALEQAAAQCLFIKEYEQPTLRFSTNGMFIRKSIFMLLCLEVSSSLFRKEMRWPFV
jgi:hypothetical protein